jgi:shikimate kinase
LTAAGAQAVHLAGAGPALFSLAESESAALKLMKRADALEAKVFAARTLGAAEATAIIE